MIWKRDEEVKSQLYVLYFSKFLSGPSDEKRDLNKVLVFNCDVSETVNKVHYATFF